MERSRRIHRAENTAQLGSEVLVAPTLGRHPEPILPRRIMPHVLIVSAFELGNPVILIVAMIADDSSRDGCITGTCHTSDVTTFAPRRPTGAAAKRIFQRQSIERRRRTQQAR
jgi:hypothetical protein